MFTLFKLTATLTQPVSSPTAQQPTACYTSDDEKARMANLDYWRDQLSAELTRKSFLRRLLGW